MINAIQARRLTNQSGGELDDYLTRSVEPRVINAAKCGSLVVVVPRGNREIDRTVTPSDLETSVIAELTKLGYQATFGDYGAQYNKLPKFITDNDGPLYVNYGFFIKWGDVS